MLIAFWWVLAGTIYFIIDSYFNKTTRRKLMAPIMIIGFPFFILSGDWFNWFKSKSEETEE